MVFTRASDWPDEELLLRKTYGLYSMAIAPHSNDLRAA